jgi:hypothetical protein
MTNTELAAIWPPTAEVSREAGHVPMSPLKAIRTKCFDCSYYQVTEIRLCEAIGCPLWPFRAGRHPWIVEAQKTRRSERVFERQTAFQDETPADRIPAVAIP